MKKVLVLCTGNCARSQIAEGLLRHYGQHLVEVMSAGTHPAGFVHPLALETMKERGIDITDQVSKPVSRYISFRFDVVITVCDDARLECPMFPGNYEQIHWSTPDPSFYPGTDEERKEAFLRTIDSLSERVMAFLRGLENETAASG